MDRYRGVFAFFAFFFCWALVAPAAAQAEEIEGHVFLEDFGVGLPLQYDGPAIDTPVEGEAVLLRRVGTLPPPGPGPVPLPGAFPPEEQITFTDADGHYLFVVDPMGVYQLSLPFLPVEQQGSSQPRIVNDPAGVIPTDPVPEEPDGVSGSSGPPTRVDFPLGPAVSPVFLFAAPADNIPIAGVFVDNLLVPDLLHGGISGRNTITAEGSQTMLDGVVITLTPLNFSAPTDTEVTGSEYTFPDPFYSGAPPVPDITTTEQGIAMFLDYELLDGESVLISVDTTQSGLDGYEVVSPTSFIQTYDTTDPDTLPAAPFRVQPVFPLKGNIKFTDELDVSHPMPNIGLLAVDQLTQTVAAMAMTDEDGDYEFPALFNTVYKIEVVSTRPGVSPFGVRQVFNAAPADLDFCFDKDFCPDGVAPVVTCPADIVEECESPDGNVISWAATATDDITPDAQILIEYSPFQPGDTIPNGEHTITVTATDWCCNEATCTFTITVQDTTAPDLSASVAEDMLWSPNHKMENPGLSASATDVCDDDVQICMTVYANQGEEATASSDDATGCGESLELRAERDAPQGRIYLVVIEAKDDSGNVSTKAIAVVVPLAPNGKKIDGIRAEAAPYVTEIDANGNVKPEGFVTLIPTKTIP